MLMLLLLQQQAAAVAFSRPFVRDTGGRAEPTVRRGANGIKERTGRQAGNWAAASNSERVRTSERTRAGGERQNQK